jgi:hypothetical protein
MPRIILTITALTALLLACAVALNGAALVGGGSGGNPAAADQAADGARQLPVQPLPPEQRDVRPIPVRPEVQLPTPRPDPRAPMLAEIHTAMTEEKATLAELRAELIAAPTDAAAAAVIARIGTVKQDVQLEILRIQLRYARERGRERQAQQIERAIAKIFSPPTPAPIHRSPPATR